MENVGRDYVAGIAAGVSTVAVGHPFDTIKVRLQTQHTNVYAYKYRGATDCFTRILKTEGVKGLYKGATSSFIGVSLESALLFGAYSQIKMALQGGDDAAPFLSTVVPAAALAGAGISVILCPTELVKCRLQIQDKANNGSTPNLQRYSGPLDCIRTTIRKEGVQGLFRGASATLTREVVGNTCFFITYETTRAYLMSSVGLNHAWRSKSGQQGDGTSASMTDILLEAGIGILSGGLSGIAFWTAVLPIDVAKTRIQTAQHVSASQSTLYHLGMVYRELGLRGFYTGLGPTLSRAFPANAAAMMTWEFTAQFLAGR